MLAEKHGFDAPTSSTRSRSKATSRAAEGDDGREPSRAKFVPLDVTTPDGTSGVHDKDEGIRYGATLESIGSVRLLRENGRISAANASQICDGASAVMVVSERALKEHNLTPLARIHHFTVTGGDPVIMLEEPLFATDRALKRSRHFRSTTSISTK